jgi:hypothetical protein
MREALRVPLPSVVAPSMNVTAPVGDPEPFVVTVAVKVTEEPHREGVEADPTPPIRENHG